MCMTLRVVKLISPNLNYLLLLGVLFMALSILAYPSTVYAVVALSCTVSLQLLYTHVHCTCINLLTSFWKCVYMCF